MYILLNVDSIHPHLDNPRKDLGDLTEEKELIYGTHKLFTKVDDEDDEA